MELRQCNRCQELLPLGEYHRDRSLRNGHRYTCKQCAKESTRLSWHKRNQKTNGLLSVHHSMKSRCICSRHKSYPRYGGRGIHICHEWLTDFGAFYIWATANGYRPGLQLDRIDNDGPYASWNCRWTTRELNIQNSPIAKLTASSVRTIRKMLGAGCTQSEIAAIFGVHQSLISNIRTGRIWRNVS
jgi:hypothetical protein